MLPPEELGALVDGFLGEVGEPPSLECVPLVLKSWLVSLRDAVPELDEVEVR